MAEGQGESQEEVLARRREEERLEAEARKKFDTTADEGNEEYEYYYGDAVNPWLSIWFRPGHTMRHILDNEPWYMIFVVAILGGMGRMFAWAFSGWSFSEDGGEFNFVVTLLMLLCGGGIAGLIGVWFWATVIQWIGTMLGGQGSHRDVMAALSWSRVPDILLLCYGICLMAFVMQEDYFLGGPGSDLQDLDIFITWVQDPWVLGYVLLLLMCFFWSLFIRIKALAEAQQYTSLQALLNIMVAYGIIVGVGWFICVRLSLLGPIVAEAFSYVIMMI